MSARNDGGPAFPRDVLGQVGMSLRDHFAGMAMQAGLMPAIEAMGDMSSEEIEAAVAERAYAMADAMLKARAA